MKKHFVTFYSPGTFFPEESTKPIRSWNVKKAMEMALKITERYGATPFGFVFTTRERKDDELDSKVVKRSGTYYLGGKLLTVEDIIKRNDPKNEILISNMKSNKIKTVIENNNSWRFVGEFRDGDVLLDYRRGVVK